MNHPAARTWGLAEACDERGSALDFAEFSGTGVASQSSYHRDRRPGELDFQDLVDAHYAPLYRFAMSLTRSESDAGDLVQETFLTWAAKGHQLRDLSKVKSWLFTTLHRRFLESQRRTTRFQHVQISETTEELPHIEPELVSRLDSQAVLALLGQVDSQFQAAVALFYLEDYSYNEISQILDVPLGTVKSRIARGLSQLRTLVTKHPPQVAKTDGRTT